MIIVELVAGLDIGEDMFGLLWMTTPAISPAFRFLEEGRGGLERSGFPNASPAAAIPTVLEATSYRCQHRPRKVDKEVRGNQLQIEGIAALGGDDSTREGIGGNFPRRHSHLEQSS